VKPPGFWISDGPLGRLLHPIGLLVAGVAALRPLLARPWVAGVPVFCIGNITVGGTGKTPVALWLGRFLVGLGRKPAYLSRGYGGSEPGPLKVEPLDHDADAVGDEPLLLAKVAPTWIGADRVATAKAAIADGADCLILDDGFQNPSLAKTCALVVVDAGVGFGNGRVIPAGPCRENPASGLKRAAAAVLIGNDAHKLGPRLARHLPVFGARLEPRAPERLAGRDVVAFAGIGRPQKFFDTLGAMGARVVRRFAFDDHHPYVAADVQPILDEAFALGAVPVTTEKDATRLPPDQRQQVDVVAVDIRWDAPEPVEDLIRAALAR
jgi:tetraacyldisaccharide 4'-kinase